MKQVFTSQDSVYLHHLKNILEAQGIDCVIKNDRLLSISGDIPMIDCWPELWVLDSIQEKWAKEIIAESKVTTDKVTSWVCENCQEEHSSRFTECWNCQSIKAF